MSDITIIKEENTLEITQEVNTIEIAANGPAGAAGTDGEGVPVGGTTGQVLAKNSNTDYDTEWINVDLSPYELLSNKVTTLASPNNNDYPTTQLLSDSLNSITPVIPVYMLSGTNSDISGYESAVALSSYTAGALATTSQTVTTAETLLEEFATNLGFPNSTAFPVGLFSFHWETQKSSGPRFYYTYAKLFKRSAGGTETLLLTSDNSSQVSANTVTQVDVTAFSGSIIPLLATDRIIVKIYARTVTGSDTITLRWDDNTDSRFQIAGSSLSYVPENVANKATSFAVINDTLYPSIQLVNSGLSGKANTSLSNLSSVAINQDLIADTDVSRSLGSSALRWVGAYISELYNAAVMRFNIAAGTLHDDSGNAVIDLAGLSLTDNTGTSAVNWQVRYLIDSGNKTSLNWESRTALDSFEIESINWESRKLKDSFIVDSVDWENRTLVNRSGSDVANWSDLELLDNNGERSIEWQARKLKDDNGIVAVDYFDRRLVASDGTTTAIDFSNPAGPTSITQTQGDNSTKIATTSYVDTGLSAKENALTISTGLTRSVNTVTNNLSTGIASANQTVTGSTLASGTLTLSSTTNATKGKILFGTSAYDEVNNRLGITQTVPTSKLEIQTNSIGGTQNTSSGIALTNATAAAAAAQQLSPALRFQGNGWKTTATAASQPVEFIIDVIPVQGTTSPTSALRFLSSINGSAFAQQMTLSNAGVLSPVALSTGSFSANSAVINGPMQSATTGTNANFSVISATAFARRTEAQFLTGGVTTSARTTFYGNTSSALTATDNHANIIVARAPLTTAASGTHATIANLSITPLGTVTSGGAAVTNSTSFYVDGASAGGTNQHAVLIAAGVTTLAPSTTTRASLNIPSGTAPSSPVNGDIWNTGTELGFRQSATTYIIDKVLKGSATLDFPSTAAGTSSDLTITVTGAADGDVVSLGVPNGSTLANGVFSAWVSAADTVKVRFTNTNLVTALDPASGTFKVNVSK